MIERVDSADNHGPCHVAAIMDGNGRWARARGLKRSEGHRAGARVARELVRAAPDLDIDIITLFALSADNWRRPPQEVHFLLQLLRRFLRLECERCVREGVRMRVIGSRKRLPARLVALIEHVERATAAGERLLVRVAIDYSSRDAILEATARMRQQDGASREAFTRALGAVERQPEPAPEVDLLIRTGGEKRLSDFLLWESAYAELYFTDIMWPEFGPPQLAVALDEFRRRERRFGLLPDGTNG